MVGSVAKSSIHTQWKSLGEEGRTGQRQESGVGWENERLERRESVQSGKRASSVVVDADCDEYASMGGG